MNGELNEKRNLVSIDVYVRLDYYDRTRMKREVKIIVEEEWPKILLEMETIRMYT